jgi:hypothetical protein
LTFTKTNQPLKGVHKMKYSDQQLNDMARSMALGTQGSFARHLGEAFLVADSGNRQTILEAFEGLFDRVARFKGINPVNEVTL